MPELPPILELGDLVPEYRPVRINRTVGEKIGTNGLPEYNTQPIVLQAFVYGDRCPVTVKATLSQVAQQYRQNVSENGYTDAFFAQYIRDSLLALIPTLSFDEADTIAGDYEQEGKAVKTLKYLNYWMLREDNTVEEENPEVVGEDNDSQTTQKSSPIST